MPVMSISDFFEGLSDSRSARNQRHPFLSIISIGILAAVAGIGSFSGMEDFAEAHLFVMRMLQRIWLYYVNGG